MPPEVGLLGRYGHHVTEALRNVPIAPGAQITLGGLVGLNESNFDIIGVGRVGLSLRW